MPSYRNSPRSTPSIPAPLGLGAVAATINTPPGSSKHFFAKLVEGPEPAVVICRRSDGKPIDRAWVKQEPATGRLFRDHVEQGRVKVVRRHYFSGDADAVAFLREFVEISEVTL